MCHVTAAGRSIPAAPACGSCPWGLHPKESPVWLLVLDGETVTHHTARYDVRKVALAFIQTGAARVAPELTRAVLHVMQTAQPQGGLQLIRHVSATAAQMGLSLGDEAAWTAADRTYPWLESISSKEYWNQMEKSL